MVEDTDKHPERREDWHQTKGLSITIILLLITNIGSTIWWAATLTSDVTQLKSKPALVERVIRLEAVSEAQYTYLNKLGITLDKVGTIVSEIGKEQARRASIIDQAEQHLSNQRNRD